MQMDPPSSPALLDENRLDHVPFIAISPQSNSRHRSNEFTQQPSSSPSIKNHSPNNENINENPQQNPNNESVTMPPLNNNTEEKEEIDILHGIYSFGAIVLPVFITMILATVVAVNFRSSILEQSMSSYLVYQEPSASSTDNGSDTSSSISFIGKSMINGLIIVACVAAMTFVMVLLYKYNCTKFLIGYLFLAAAGTLGYVGGQLTEIIFVQHAQIPIDWICFSIIMYNFAIVGIVAVFYQKGCPQFLQQAYLVLMSMILAWQFSMWPEWSTWTFCCLFACYDLCAVLTPCGPLKCLIGLIQQRQTPMPGLLYEANIHNYNADTIPTRPSQRASEQQANCQRPSHFVAESYTAVNENENTNASIHKLNANVEKSEEQMPTADFAVTAMYSVMDWSAFPIEASTIEEFKQYIILFYHQFYPRNAIKADFIANKCFARQRMTWEMLYHKYRICSCENGEDCPVQIRHNEYQKEEEEGQTIKLGLGDFIFYSVLVARAGMYDFSAFVISILCILVGLGSTLLLLTVFRKALPALPISIFTATIFYFWTRFVIFTFLDVVSTTTFVI